MADIILTNVTEGYENTVVGAGVTAGYIPSAIEVTTETIIYNEGVASKIPDANEELHIIKDDLITKYVN